MALESSTSHNLSLTILSLLIIVHIFIFYRLCPDARWPCGRVQALVEEAISRRLRVNERFSGNSPAFLFLLVLHLFLQHTHSHLHPLLHSCLQLHPHQHFACRRHSTSAAAPLSSRDSRDGRPERNRENRKLIES